MRRLFLPLICCGLLVPTGRAQNQLNLQASGAETSLDGTWQFEPATGVLAPASTTPAAVDAKAHDLDQGFRKGPVWPDVQVPQFLNHATWWLSDVSLEYEAQEKARVAALPFDAEATESGWYAHTLSVPALASGAARPEVHIKFEGVAMVSRAYCNGHYVGGHTGMFGSYDCRLTPYLNWGGENRLLVYVERGGKGSGEEVGVAVTMAITQDMFTSLNSGLFGGFGRGPKARFMGVWQPVTLKVSQPGGRLQDVFFDPALDGHTLTFTVQNPGDQPVSGQLHYRIADAKSDALLAEETVAPAVSVAPGASQVVTARKSGLQPVLWTPDFPHLYRLTVQWQSTDGQVLDTYACRVGYRTVATRGEQVLLNGKPYWARGANMPPYGYRPNSAETARNFLQKMHDSNLVVTRAHGNPWNHLWLDAADEAGVGVSVEGVRPWALMSKNIAPPQPILDQWKAEQLETTVEYRNHPSALFYCISNEGLQGDHDNPAKLGLFKDIIEAVRRVDPSRPIFQTSGDPDAQDIADIEDVHAYWGWYEPSSFVNDYTKPRQGLSLEDHRPFIDQECAVPYQMIDTGGVHPTYLDKYMAQVWVGDLGTFGPDVSYFSEHTAAEAKLKTEKLRYSRKQLPTAGMLLFNCSTWMQGALSRPAGEWKPLPVWTATAEALQPVLAALETTQRVFFTGAEVNTNVYVVNDDARFRDLHGLTLTADLLDGQGAVAATQRQPFADVPYYDVQSRPLVLTIPALPGADSGPAPATIRLRLTGPDGAPVCENHYPIRVAARAWATRTDKKLAVTGEGCGEAVNRWLSTWNAAPDVSGQGQADVLVLGPGAKELDEAQIRRTLKPGGRVVVLENPAVAAALCPGLLTNAETPTGEFVEMLGWTDRPAIFDGLGAMDWKWWAQAGKPAAYVCDSANRLDATGPGVIPLGRYLAPHLYWKDLQKTYEEKVGYPVVAIRRDWGEILVCDLTISESISLDPRAGKTLTNFLTQPLARRDVGTFR